MPNIDLETQALTPKQKRILDFISEFAAENGYAPSQQEIARHFGFRSLGTVQNYLVRLERQGFLKKAWNARRGMAVVPVEAPAAVLEVPRAVPLPLVGRVAAGLPIEAIETRETIDVPASMVGLGEHFVLRVAGDSMIGDGILDGDFVVVKKQAQAQNGQTVVALVGNEATIKRFYRVPGRAPGRGPGRHADRVELRAANPAYDPIIIESLVENPDFRLEGILVGVIRRLE